MKMKMVGVTFAFLFLAGLSQTFGESIPSGAALYIDPNAGFETYLTAAISKKKVNVVVVMDKTHADFEVTSSLEHGKEPGFAQTWVLGKRQRNEDASVNIINTKTTAVVWAYSVHKYDAKNGEQSTAEAVAKHLKDVVGR